MGIYIRGMEMPHDCDECRLCAFIPVGDYGIHRKCLPLNANAEITIRRANCPLIELPSHGRLIDADALAKDYDGFPVRIDPWVWNELSHAPTIIPAEPYNDLAKPNIEADYPPSIPLKQVWAELFGEDDET